MSNYQKKEIASLCCTCRYACSKRCSWARDFTPVNGWTLTDDGTVSACPQYEEGRGLPRNMDTEGMMLLLEAAAEQVREDYIHGVDQTTPGKEEKRNKRYHGMNLKERMIYEKEMRADNRRNIEKWLRGPGCGLLQITPDIADQVIKSLQQLVAKFEKEKDRMVSRL